MNEGEKPYQLVKELDKVYATFPFSFSTIFHIICRESRGEIL